MTTDEILESSRAVNAAASALKHEAAQLNAAIRAGKVSRADCQLARARLEQRAEFLHCRQAQLTAEANALLAANAEGS